MATTPIASSIVAPVAEVSSTVNVSVGSVARSARIESGMPAAWAPAAIVATPDAATRSFGPAVPATVRHATLTGPAAT